ncbi:MAG TPA: helix-turn-helix transcriptional regulator [Acidimicrobiales bacterium]|nr:helix-turn-helix transcriptional regulator [Acidimicrobiales bacterium]
MKGQALKGHMDLLVLAVLADGAKHGYAVIEHLKTRSGDVFDLPEGTVYPVLHRLERSGHLASDWSVVQGRRRRTYAITPKGLRAFGEQRKAWAGFSEAVSNVIGGSPWPATS